MYGYLPPISKTSKSEEQYMQDTAGGVRRNCGTHHMDEQVLDDQLEPISNNSVRTQGVGFKSC